MKNKEMEISTLENALLNRDQESFWKITNNLKPSLLFDELVKQMDLFEDFGRYCAEDFKIKLEPIGHYPFASYCIYGIQDWSVTRSKLQRHLKKFDMLKVISDDIDAYVYENFAEQCNLFLDYWVIGERANNALRKWNLDFSTFNSDVKIEVKEYIHSLVKNELSREKIQAILSHIKIIYTEWETIYEEKLLSFSQIKYFHVQHLATHFQQSEKKYALGTIRHFFTSTKLFINWLIERNGANVQNPFEKYIFRNVQAYSKGTEYIPDFVLEKLNDNLVEFPLTAQRIWTVLIHTGMRISEALNLEEGCIRFDETNKIHILTYMPSKTAKSRAKNNLLPYHEIPVPQPVYDAISAQEKETEILRNESNLQNIFIRKGKNRVSVVSSKTIADQINKTIQKLNIVSSDGEFFHYKHHMCRKTFVVEMMEKGHTISDIADYVNHLSKDTTEKYYRDLKLEKIAELDAKMFEQLFEETLDEKIKSLYSVEEKKSLMDEIKLGVRETPEGHGFCAKHVSFGPCVKKKCVGCNLLVTGPQKLPKWYLLYKEQQEYLDGLKEEFENNAVTNYEENRLYQQEVNLLKIYADTIQKTEKFAERAGISIEAYKPK